MSNPDKPGEPGLTPVVPLDVEYSVSEDPNESSHSNSDLEGKLKKMEERIASLERNLRSDRADRFWAFHQLRSEMAEMPRQWRWYWIITAGSALFIALVALGIILQPFVRLWLQGR